MRVLFLLFALALPAAAGEIEDLVLALGDDDYEKREKASDRLLEIGAPAIPALREAAKSEDAEVRAKATRALALIEWRTALPPAFLAKYPEAPAEILTADDETLVRWVQMLGATCPGAEAVAPAMRFLDLGTGRIRKDALLLVSRRAAVLPTVRDAEGLERLVPLLTDPDTGLRVLSLSVAGEWGRGAGSGTDRLAEVVRKKVMPAALSGLAATDGTVRSAAARTLGRIGDSTAVAKLSEAAGDPVSAVRMAAIEALGLIGDPRGAKAAIGALQDQGTDVVRAAIDACGRMKAREAAPAIREALAVEGRAPILRQAALEALSVLDPPAIEDARRCLADVNATLRAIAWRIALSGPDAAEAVKAAQDEDAEVRLVAAEALARAPREAAVAALLALLDDDRSATLRDARGNDLIRGEVRDVAMRALEKLTGRKEEGDTDERVAGWRKWIAGGEK